MATFSFIIPVYQADDQLDICLLSILGQVLLPEVEVVCVPVVDGVEKDLSRLDAWQRRDNRVKTLAEHLSAPTLYDAFRLGIAAASGSYLMFVRQTDVITSVDSLSQAFTIAEQLDLQVLLAAKEQHMDIDSFSPSERIVPKVKLLPESVKSDVYSIADAGVNLLIMTPSIVYGNIYQRSYMASLFSTSHVFGSCADLAVSQIALLHAQRVSHLDVATIRSRYISDGSSLVSLQELSLTVDTLFRQVTVKLATSHAQAIVQNILLFYLAFHLASQHPYSSFLQGVEHYKPICEQLCDPLVIDITPHLSGCQRYISSIVHSDPDSLLETYTMPARGLVFPGHVVRRYK